MKKVVAICIFLMMAAATIVGVVFSKQMAENEQVGSPVLVITGPKEGANISSGDDITFTAHYEDNEGIVNIWLTEGSIVLHGFEADITIEENEFTPTIIFENVQITDEQEAYSFSITGGTAADEEGNLCNSKQSPEFFITQ